jgi:hypothetical protein
MPSNTAARLGRARKREEQSKELQRQTTFRQETLNRAEEVVRRLSDISLVGPATASTEVYVARLVLALQLMVAAGREKQLKDLSPWGGDARAEAVEIYHLLLSGSEDGRREAVRRLWELSESGMSSFMLEVDSWLRLRLPCSIFEDVLHNEPVDKWIDLQERLENAEITISLLDCNGDLAAMREVLKDLWDRGDWTGGIDDLPPHMPTVVDKGSAVRAIAVLLEWVRTHRVVTRESPAGEAIQRGIVREISGAAGTRAEQPPQDGASRPVASASLEEVEQAAREDASLTFVPGAFIYRGHQQDLGGKPLAVIQALDQAQMKTLTLTALQDKVWPEANIGNETIRSAVKVARKTLREAIRTVGHAGDDHDPIPVVDRGSNATAWRLRLP